ncbi:MAG: zinc-ribbon domain containing protein [Candidatus Zixiibacteriota bacterium]|nr:MAG: zinc-ribbon domain containing protein [candidate division Zixibacteria bacterium]
MASGFEPKILICTECNEEFVFTVAAQEYFAERGYTEDPKRCKTCHTKYKKANREQRHHQSVEQPHFEYPE